MVIISAQVWYKYQQGLVLLFMGHIFIMNKDMVRSYKKTEMFLIFFDKH